jgi:hypothetical protein
MMSTYEDRLSSDGAILGFNMKLSLFADLFAVTLLFGKLKAEFFNFIANECDSLGCFFEGCFEAGILSLGLDYYL